MGTTVKESAPRRRNYPPTIEQCFQNCLNDVKTMANLIKGYHPNDADMKILQSAFFWGVFSVFEATESAETQEEFDAKIRALKVEIIQQLYKNDYSRKQHRIMARKNYPRRAAKLLKEFYDGAGSDVVSAMRKLVETFFYFGADFFFWHVTLEDLNETKEDRQAFLAELRKEFVAYAEKNFNGKPVKINLVE